MALIHIRCAQCGHDFSKDFSVPDDTISVDDGDTLSVPPCPTCMAEVLLGKPDCRLSGFDVLAGYAVAQKTVGDGRIYTLRFCATCKEWIPKIVDDTFYEGDFIDGEFGDWEAFRKKKEMDS